MNYAFLMIFRIARSSLKSGGGAAVTQSVESTTLGQEVLALIPAVAALSLLVVVSKMWPAETEVMVSPLCLVCGNT